MSDKVVLAYSGGLDTSVAINWIKEKYNLDVIALTVDVGNERDFSAIRQKAVNVGAIKALVVDAKDSFVNEYVSPPLFGEDVYSITLESSIAARDVIGGTAPKRVDRALAAAKKLLGESKR